MPPAVPVLAALCLATGLAHASPIGASTTLCPPTVQADEEVPTPVGSLHVVNGEGDDVCSRVAFVIDPADPDAARAAADAWLAWTPCAYATTAAGGATACLASAASGGATADASGVVASGPAWTGCVEATPPGVAPCLP